VPDRMAVRHLGVRVGQDAVPLSGDKIVRLQLTGRRSLRRTTAPSCFMVTGWTVSVCCVACVTHARK